MQITNGLVEYEHPHKVGDYQIPKARVSLSFLIPEGEDPDMVLGKVGDLARAHAMRIVGAQAAVLAPAPAAEAAPAAHRGPGRPRVAPPKVEPAPEPLPAPPKVEPAPEPLPAPPKVEPAPSAPDDAFSPQPAAGEVDPFGSTAAAVATPPNVDNPRLTDAGIKTAVGSKIAKSGDQPSQQAMTLKVKALITSFTGAPALPIYTVKEPARRLEFLTALDAL